MAEKELIVKFGADVAGMQKQIQKASSTIQKEMQSASNGVGKSFDDMLADADKVAGSIEKDFKSINFNFDKPTQDAIKKLDKVKQKSKDSADDTESAFSKIGNSIKKAFAKGRKGAEKDLSGIGDKAKQEADQASDAFEDAGDKIKGALAGLAGAFAVGSITSFVDEMATVAVDTSKLKSAFETAGASAKDATKIYDDFYSILGEEDTAVEASQLLVNMTSDTKEMSKWTNIATGVFATFGDSLPIEGMIESANETAKVGQVTGSLADALNWAGINEDKFNAKLEKCSSEAERQKLITDTLNDTYAKSAEAYKENNSELIDYHKAQGQMKATMQDLAMKIMPIVTSGMQNVTNAIKTGMEMFSKYKTEIGAVAIVLGGMIIALQKTAIINGFTNAIGGIKSAFALLTSPVGLVIIGISALVAGFVVAYKKSETFRNAVNNLKDKCVEAWNAIKTGATQLKDKVVGAWESISAKLSPYVDIIKINLVGAFNSLKDAGNGLADAFGFLKEKFSPVAKVLGGLLKDALEGIKKKFDELKPKLEEFAKGALKKIAFAIANAKTNFDKFRKICSKVWTAMKPVVSMIAKNLVKALKGIKAPIKSMVDSFGSIWRTLTKKLIPAIVDKLMPIWKGLKVAIKGVATVFGGVLVTAIGIAMGVINGIIKAVKGIFKVLSGLAKIVSNVFKLIVGIFTGDGEAIKDACKGIFDGVIDTFKGLWSAIKGFVKGLVDGVVGFFTKLWDILVGHSIVPDTIDGIVECFKSIWGKIKGFCSAVFNGVKTVFTKLKDTLTKIWNVVKSVIQTVWGWIKKYIVPIAKWIWEKVKTYFTNLKNNLTTIWNVVKSAINKVWGWIKQYIVPVAKWIWDKVKTYFTNLKNNLTTIWNAVKSVVLKVWNWIKVNIVQRVIKIVHEVKTRFDKMKYTLGKIWQLILEKVKQVWNWIKENIWSRVVSIYNNVKNKFTSLKDKVVSIFTTVKNKVSSVWGWIKENIWGKVVWIYNKVKDKFTSLKDKIVGTVGKIWKGVKSGMKNLCNKGFIRPLNTIISKFLGGINTIITGVNWVIKKISGKKDFFGKIQVSKWKIPELAKGTNNWQGGTALVGEAGREIVSDPKLGTFVTPAPMLLPLSKGASVLRNSKTEKLLADMGVPAFKKGKKESWLSKLGSKIKDGFEKVKDIVGALWDKVPKLTGVQGWVKELFSGLKGKLTDKLKSFFTKKQDENASTWTGNKGTYKERWKNYAKGWATKALKNAGYEAGSKKYRDFLTAFEIVGRYESGYNNSAWNKTDKNAQKGTPSKGWLQFIEPTFKDYKFKGYGKWLDPVHQAMAFINYANKKYGGSLKVPGVKSVLAGGKYKPYANGGLITSPTMALMGEAGKEAVVPLSNSNALKPFGNSVADSILSNTSQAAQSDINATYEFTIPVIVDGREIAKATATFTKEELDKLEKRGNRRNGNK